MPRTVLSISPDTSPLLRVDGVRSELAMLESVHACQLGFAVTASAPIVTEVKKVHIVRGPLLVGIEVVIQVACPQSQFEVKSEECVQTSKTRRMA
jgi:hypothetical protein